MNVIQHLLVFSLDEHKYALPLSCVEQVVQSVAVSGLPGAPPVVLGIISVRGQVLPVINMRRRFGLTDRVPQITDRFVIARSAQRRMALGVDRVDGVVETLGSNITPASEIAPDTAQFQGAFRNQEDMVLIQDLDRLLISADADSLNQAVDRILPSESDSTR
jgi:purine-binding chemotaxis protein CheW